MVAPKPRFNNIRICCELIDQQGRASINDLMPVCELGESVIRYSVARGVELGYLVEGEKVDGLGRTARKTYLRTDKPLPDLVDKDEEPQPTVDWSKYTPRRDWAVEVLFGPYEARA